MEKIKIAKKGIVFFLATVFFSFSFSVVWAEETKKLEKVDCFDYYNFPSVSVDLLSSSVSVPSGTFLHITAEITNNKDYPIIDGTVYVKIFKRRGVKIGEEKNYFQEIPDDALLTKGDDLVDQLFALEDINLDGKEKKKIDFNWRIPSYLPSGKYYMAAFFVSAKRFNLLGLPFTDDVIGSSMNLDITNDEFSGNIEWDKTSVKINNEKYNFVGFLKAYPADTDISIIAPIANTTSRPAEVKISWETYYWDNLLEKNKIKEYNETIILQPGEIRDVSYRVEKNNLPVNYLVATAKYKDRKSILDIRFERKSVALPRINFPAFAVSPFSEEESIPLFTCLHMVKERDVLFEPALRKKFGFSEKKDDEYQVFLSVKDEKNNLLGEYVYEGVISGEMMGLKGEYLPRNRFNVLTLEAKIKDRQGKVLDSIAMRYDCQNINPNLCGAGKGNALVLVSLDRTGKNIVLFLTALAFVIIAIYFLRKKLKAGSHSLWLMLVFISGGIFLISGEVEAKTVSPSIGDFRGSVAYKSPSAVPEKYSPELNFWWALLKDPVATIIYTSSNSLGENDNLKLRRNDNFSLEDVTAAQAHSITWNLTGFSLDSPDGYWNKDAEFDPMFDGKENDLAYDTRFAYFRYILYTPLIFNPPIRKISITGPITCTQETDKRWGCVVDSDAAPGPATVTINYERTYGKWYSHGIAIDSSFVPMIKYEILDTVKKKVKCKEFKADHGSWRCIGNFQSCSIGDLNLDGKNGSREYNFDDCCEECREVRPIASPASITYAYDIIVPHETNNPPTPPECIDDGSGSCPSSLLVDQDGKFIFRSTDHENDSLFYQIDWNGDEIAPFDGSPILLFGKYDYSTLHRWINVGAKIFKARACDNVGVEHCSNWSEFAVNVYPTQCTINTTISGSGTTGVVTSTPAGINCSSGGAGDCTESVGKDTSFTLGRTFGETSDTFDGWTGDCTPSADGTRCVVDTSSASNPDVCVKNVTATFTEIPSAMLPLTVRITGDGDTGKVEFVEPSRHECSQDVCVRQYSPNTEVTLRGSFDETKDKGGVWSGEGCTNRGNGAICSLTMSGSKSVAYRVEPRISRRYKCTDCSGCVEDSGGEYESLGACRDACSEEECSNSGWVEVKP